jgi:hypothetical protein
MVTPTEEQRRGKDRKQPYPKLTILLLPLPTHKKHKFLSTAFSDVGKYSMCKSI